MVTATKKKTVKRRKPKSQPNTADKIIEPKKKPKLTEKQKARDAIATMNEALLKKFNEIQLHINGARRDDARHRYKAARDIKEVLSEKEYGDRARSKLAKALGWSPDKLDQYEKVAETWVEKEFAALLKKKNCYGQPLCWSHFVVAAHETEKQKRERLLQLALTEGVPARKLKKHRKGQQADGKKMDADVCDTTPTELRRMADNYSTQANAAIRNLETWGESLAQRINDAVPDELGQDLAKKLTDARSELKTAYERENARLIACIAKIQAATRAPKESTKRSRNGSTRAGSCSTQKKGANKEVAA